MNSEVIKNFELDKDIVGNRTQYCFNCKKCGKWSYCMGEQDVDKESIIIPIGNNSDNRVFTFSGPEKIEFKLSLHLMECRGNKSEDNKKIPSNKIHEVLEILSTSNSINTNQILIIWDSIELLRKRIEELEKDKK